MFVKYKNPKKNAFFFLKSKKYSNFVSLKSALLRNLKFK